MTVRATWNGVVLAESDHTIALEGRRYFPPADVDHRRLEASRHRSTCFWKGRASYFDVVADGKRLADAAWVYPDPSAAAREIAGHIAFWKGVDVSDTSTESTATQRRGFLRRLVSS